MECILKTKLFHRLQKLLHINLFVRNNERLQKTSNLKISTQLNSITGKMSKQNLQYDALDFFGKLKKAVKDTNQKF